MNVKSVALSFALGVVAGSLGVIASNSPLDRPLIGMTLGALLIAVGSAVCIGVGGRFAGVLYSLVAVALTVWLMWFTPGSDIVVVSGSWIAKLWPVIVVVAGIMPVVLHRSRQK